MRGHKIAQLHTDSVLASHDHLARDELVGWHLRKVQFASRPEYLFELCQFRSRADGEKDITALNSRAGVGENHFAALVRLDPRDDDPGTFSPHKRGERDAINALNFDVPPFDG